jgi:lipopolysaccharide/colanic/teichoic acid biosynthesis glycosyltransferase
MRVTGFSSNSGRPDNDPVLERSGMTTGNWRIHSTRRSPRPQDSMSSSGSAPVSKQQTQKIRVPAKARRDPHVLGRELFRDVLTREHKRADRLDRGLVLLLVVVETGHRGSDTAGDRIEADARLCTSSTDAGWMKVIDALNAATDHTSIVGWLEPGRVLGAILPDSASRDAEAKLHLELLGSPDSQINSRFSIRTIAYSQEVGKAEARWTGNPLLVRLVSPDHRESGSYGSYRVKRSVDFVGSLVLLLALSPLLLLVAVLLKLTSRGPAVFCQKRVGENGRPFTMLKFRTMRADADYLLHHEYVTKFIKSTLQVPTAGTEAPFKLTNDPRVTPLGRLLRKTSLDELPQLWNVLRGDMSLVGPRPALEYEVAEYQPWHWRRVLEAKPGMTGLWQVVGRSRTTFDEMVRLDLRYVRNRSLWTDIKILFATPRAVISGKGAG